MNILLLCPAHSASGGTESIHNLAHHLSLLGADVKILYTGKDLNDPQPEQFKKYNVDYITEYPQDYKGAVIFPEVYANRVLEPQFKNIIPVVNWLGVDVYDWNVPKDKRGLYLQRKDVIHVANSEYGMKTLTGRGLHPVRMIQVLNDDYYNIPDTPTNRGNVVLFNPIKAKLTAFQKAVMNQCREYHNIEFRAIQGLTRSELIELFRHSKLYLDLGVFSGRERLPREAVMCGCCIVTSNTGAAQDYKDNSIPDRYKVSTVDNAVCMVEYALSHYYECKHDFDDYRQIQRQDKENYMTGVKNLYAEILNHHTSV